MNMQQLKQMLVTNDEEWNAYTNENYNSNKATFYLTPELIRLFDYAVITLNWSEKDFKKFIKQNRQYIWQRMNETLASEIKYCLFVKQQEETAQEEE